VLNANIKTVVQKNGVESMNIEDMRLKMTDFYIDLHLVQRLQLSLQFEQQQVYKIAYY